MAIAAIVNMSPVRGREDNTEDAAPMPSPSDAGEAETAVDVEVKTKPRAGRGSAHPKLFVLLTCGFVACLVCVAGAFGIGGIAVMRTANLKTAIEDIGVPSGWHLIEQSTLPWGASTHATGPRDDAAFANWLAQLDIGSSGEAIAACLSSPEPCVQEFEHQGFDAVATFGADDDRAELTIEVG